MNIPSYNKVEKGRLFFKKNNLLGGTCVPVKIYQIDNVQVVYF